MRSIGTVKIQVGKLRINTIKQIKVSDFMHKTVIFN